MNTSHHPGGAPVVFFETARAITAADISASTVIGAIRQKFIELPLLDSPDGSPLSWDNFSVNKGKKRLTLRVPCRPDQMVQVFVEDWLDCKYLEDEINAWFRALGSPWRFHCQPINNAVEVEK